MGTKEFKAQSQKRSGVVRVFMLYWRAKLLKGYQDEEKGVCGWRC